MTASASARIDRFLEIVHGIVTVALVAWAGWLTTTVIEYGQWRASVDASRFKASDGAEVWQEIAEIRRQMVITSNTPPVWFVQRMDRMEAQLDAIEERLRKVEARQ